MGRFADYIERLTSSDEAMTERRRLLAKISQLRGGRDVLVFASDFNKDGSMPTLIDNNDIIAVQDQLENMNGDDIDIILVTMGGYGEAVEDIVKLIRNKYKHVGMIIPGQAKSAGTVFAMAGDEILMGEGSALGPIDAQVMGENNAFSADAFLDGFDKIKREMESTQKLSPVYIPMLQSISPGDIENCRHLQCFSRRLVADWLVKYKFKDWEKHSDGSKVTTEERCQRAEEIAQKLASQSRWLTHSRSIRIEDLEQLGLKITDYRKKKDLNDVITRYYMLLMISFERSPMYKLFETVTSQISRIAAPVQPIQVPDVPPSVMITPICSNCGYKFKVQLNLRKHMEVYGNALPYPLSTDMIDCPQCGTMLNLRSTREKIEAETGMEAVE